MKFLPFLLLLLSGCATLSPPRALPQAVPEPAAAPPVAALDSRPAPAELERKLFRQAQIIEALISQNDTLTAKLAGNAPDDAKAGPAPTPDPELPATVPPAAPAPFAAAALAPNADGMIDLAAVEAAAGQEGSVNPFAVRAVSADAVREIVLRVAGVVSGMTPCAVINERLVAAGEMVESLAVEEIERDGVVLRHGEYRLRVPVAEKPVRVRVKL